MLLTDALSLPNGEQWLLFYLHIPKAAGTTLNTVIDREFKPEQIYTIAARPQDYLDGIPRSQPENRASQRFFQLTPSQRNRIRVLRGHMGFGFHRHFRKPVLYITLLRDPVDRLISHYYFVKQTPQHYLHEDLVSAHMSLEDYVTSDLAYELDNGQTRVLSGFPAMGIAVPIGQCDRNMLRCAKQNIAERIALAGIAESFDDFLLMLRKLLQWRMPFYAEKNVTAHRPKKSEISAPLIRRIEEINRLDMELHEFVGRKFTELVQRRGGVTVRERERFRLQNAIFKEFVRDFFCAQEDFHHGRWLQSEDKLRRICESEPQFHPFFIEAFIYLGEIQHSQGKTMWRKWCQRALQLLQKHNLGTALEAYRIASLHQRLNDYPGAKKEFAKILRQKIDPPRRAGVHFHLGAMAATEGKVSKAKRHFLICLHYDQGHRAAQSRLNDKLP